MLEGFILSLVIGLDSAWRPCPDSVPVGSTVAVVDPVTPRLWPGELIGSWPNGFRLVKTITDGGGELLIGAVVPYLACPVRAHVGTARETPSRGAGRDK
jgi:hypothetical protein